ncbi:3',5'-cyclic-AMP phosphodiesterase [Thiohalobacter sp. IOR34]|uniref:3',5'-cyclic-AMP phosphodiesterase n=1 Tax=Thiohalobacter sp. IOR34 TaxID=3057176 RepID=UPI0025B24DC8|nr:3',5'-cyclic-AMP phosphodiesterase [Thiohalobacter sp. IOR34]WJW75173.1 3',5'-cyclic-AMP phosphodiesterase [Thiohalobacter sp. IOR34]
MAARPVELAQITDCHLFADPEGRLKGVQTEATLAAVIALVRQRHEHLDAVLASGDLVHDGSEAGYRRLHALFGGLRAPVYCVPGNHDETGAMRRSLDGRRLQWVRQADLGPWRIVFLDSSLPDSEGGHLDEAEFAALEASLAGAGARHVLVCLHHPPLRVGSHWLDTMVIDNGDHLLERLAAEPRVRGLVCGHIHQNLDLSLGQLRLLGSPSTCIQFLPDSETFTLEAIPPGYRWLRLLADGRIETGIERIADLPAGLELTPEEY